jgi:hypothetical protein
MPRHAIGDPSQEELGLMDAADLVKEFEQKDPVNAPQYLKGALRGLALSYGELVGHGEAADLFELLAAKCRRRQEYVDDAQALTDSAAAEKHPFKPPPSAVELVAQSLGRNVEIFAAHKARRKAKADGGEHA